ncbi:hypothetical protein [Deinococcus altitudinis]|uniref:hypothetical protein n=1 Tax=Deinococcus altitudinis TaxID=468914 RepID=UPI003891439F
MKKLLLVSILALTACAPTLGDSSSRAVYRADSASLLRAVVDDCKQIRLQDDTSGLKATSSGSMTHGVEPGSGTVTCEDMDAPTPFSLTLMAEQHADKVTVTVKSNGASPSTIKALLSLLDKQFARLPD